MTPTESQYNVLGERIIKANVKSVQYNDLMNVDEAMREVVNNVWAYGFGLVDGVPADMEGTTFFQSKNNCINFYEHLKKCTVLKLCGYQGNVLLLK